MPKRKRAAPTSEPEDQVNDNKPKRQGAATSSQPEEQANGKETKRRRAASSSQPQERTNYDKPKCKRNTSSPKPQDHSKDLNHSVLGGLKDPTLDSRVSGDEAEPEPGVQHISIPFNSQTIICERRSPQNQDSKDAKPPALIFTHGAGGGIANPATQSFAAGFALVSPVACFQGTMNLKNRIKTFHATVEHEDAEAEGVAALGGRSMGARAAVITASEMEKTPEALVLVSYPLTGGKKGEKRDEARQKILLDLPASVDVLFISGDGDAMCDLELLDEVVGKMKARCWRLIVKGADHGMSLRDKTGVPRVRMWTGIMAAHWLQERSASKRHCAISWNSDAGEISRQDWQRNAT